MILASAGLEEKPEVEGTRTQIENITPNKIAKIINSKIERIDTTYLKFYGKGEIPRPTENIYQSVNLDPITGYPISDASTITKLNLANATNLTTIGNGSLTTIGESAFKGSKLTSVTIPRTVTSIGDYAFYGSNNNITTLTIPNSVTTIGSNVFPNAAIQSLTIDMTTIPSSTFNSKGIQTLTVGNHTQTISSSAFQYNQISSLNLSNATSLDTIGEYAFYYNQISGTLTIPNSITSIGEYAFSYNYDNILGQNTITTINIDMTQATWNSRNLSSNTWYDGSVVPTFNS